jgi:DNA-binding NarL/FixJ family response regulator
MPSTAGPAHLNERIRIVIIDDHDLVREGLRSVLARHDDLEVVGEAASAADAIRVVQETSPDLILLDLRLGEHDGVAVARSLRGQDVTAKILVLSIQDASRDLRSALAAGADGYLLKSVSGDALADGIRSTMAGETVIGHEFVPKLLADAARGEDRHSFNLTGREQQVLELIAAGQTSRAIAERLSISPRTAQKHIENLFTKFDVHDRAELVTNAFRHGVIE